MTNFMKKTVFILVLLFIIIATILYIYDNKKVKLTFVNNGSIIQPTLPYCEEEYFILQIAGSDFKNEICKRINWRKYQEWDSIRGCRINWDSDLIINNDSIYYVGIGCKIDKIKYKYHSRYGISMNNPPQGIIYFSSTTPPKLTPLEDKTSIMLYEGDVMLVP